MKTIEQLRREIETAKLVAMARFESDWGTRDVATVMGALRKAIPTSTSPADAVRKARRFLGEARS